MWCLGNGFLILVDHREELQQFHLHFGHFFRNRTKESHLTLAERVKATKQIIYWTMPAHPKESVIVIYVYSICYYYLFGSERLHQYLPLKEFFLVSVGLSFDLQKPPRYERFR